MTIRHLKTFIAVCEYGGITKAAEALHVAQPAVSQTVAELERYYGIVLFDRFGKKLVLTDCGKRLLAKAKETTASFDDFENLANSNLQNNRIRIGASLTIGKRFLPQILNTVAQKLPKIKPCAVIDNRAEIEEMLLAGDLDFAFLEGAAESPNLYAEEIAGDRLVAVCGAAFNAPGELKADGLEKYPLLLREVGSASRRAFESAAGNIDIDILVESASNGALITCAENNLGIAVLPEALVDGYIATGRLKEIKITDCSFKRKYFAAYHKNKRFSPQQREAFDVCVSVFKQPEFLRGISNT